MQRRRFLSLLLVLCMALTCLPGVSRAEEAPSLPLDTVTTVTIDEAKEVAKFSFTPTQTGLYRISSESDDDGFCLLMNADNYVLNLDDDSGEGKSFSLTALLRAGETYRYEIQCGDDSTTGTFDILLTFLGTPTATALTIDTPVTVTTTGDMPAAYYSFTPAKSGDYTLSAVSDDDTFCRLYDSSWKQIGYSDDLSDESRDFALTAFLTAGQTYYYEVRYYSNQSGSFQICLKDLTLALDTFTTVSITPEYPVAHYSFTPAKSGYYALSADSNGADTICSLYDGDGTWLQEVDDSEDSMDFYLAAFLNAGETYRYDVGFISSAAFGSFDILLTYVGEPEEVVLTPDVPVTVNIPAPGVSVFCTFTPGESGYYALSADSAGGDTVCWLYDAEGNCMMDNDDSETGPDFRLLHYLTAGETYTYEVRYYDDVTVGSFDLLLTLAVPEQKITLTPGQAVSVTIPEAGVNVECTFTPTQTGYYSLTTTAEGVAVNCQLDHEAGDTYCSADNTERSSDTVIKVLLLEGHTYFFRLYVPDITYTGSFDILLSYLGEPPVNVLPLEDTVTATSEEPSPFYYSFTPGESGEYVLTVAPGTETVCRLYDGNWNQLDSYVNLEEAADVQITYDLTGGELYYFVISDLYLRVRTFDIQLTHTSYPRELVLTPDEPATVVISQPDGTVSCTFVPQVSGYYTLASSSGGDTYCSLYGPWDGEQVLLGTDDETYTGSDFCMRYYLLAGESYTYEVGYYESTDTGSFDVLLTYTGATTPSGKIGNWMIDRYHVSDLVLGADGIYRTPLGSTVYIPVDNREDGGAFIIDSFTLMDAAIHAGEYLDLTYWDALTARMDDDGYVVLTEETLGYLVTTITGNAELGLAPEHAALLLFYDYPPADSKPDEDLPGDVNGDGTVDAVDAYYIILHYSERVALSGDRLALADVDSNGRVDLADAHLVTLFANGQIDAFPADHN